MSLSQNLETQERGKAIITWDRKAAREGLDSADGKDRLLPTDLMRRPPQQGLQTGQGRVGNRPRALCTLLLMASSAPLQMAKRLTFPSKNSSNQAPSRSARVERPASTLQSAPVSLPRGTYDPPTCPLLPTRAVSFTHQTLPTILRV